MEAISQYVPLVDEEKEAWTGSTTQRLEAKRRAVFAEFGAARDHNSTVQAKRRTAFGKQGVMS